MNPIDLVAGFLFGLAAGALLRGGLNNALNRAAVALSPDSEGEELAEWGGAYPRVDTTAADEAAPTPSRR
jgi:hypothetical protein